MLQIFLVESYEQKNNPVMSAHDYNFQHATTQQGLMAILRYMLFLLNEQPQFR